MAFHSWRDAAEAIAAELSSPERELLDLAVSLGVQVSRNEQRALVVARIEDAVSELTRNRLRRPATTAQRSLLAALSVPLSGAESVREADALIRTGIANERLDALRVLQPERGDKLVRKVGRPGEVVEVSSIDRLGQIWMKGAGGYPTRPQDLSRP